MHTTLDPRQLAMGWSVGTDNPRQEKNDGEREKGLTGVRDTHSQCRHMLDLLEREGRIFLLHHLPQRRWFFPYMVPPLYQSSVWCLLLTSLENFRKKKAIVPSRSSPWSSFLSWALSSCLNRSYCHTTGTQPHLPPSPRTMRISSIPPPPWSPRSSRLSSVFCFLSSWSLKIVSFSLVFLRPLLPFSWQSSCLRRREREDGWESVLVSREERGTSEERGEDEGTGRLWWVSRERDVFPLVERLEDEKREEVLLFFIWPAFLSWEDKQPEERYPWRCGRADDRSRHPRRW